ncbi:MAG: hypothetical protein H6712_29355 [Myxococcales bacterium]|nr:hypothetical protein [Myxococcales bacterium]
MATRSKTTTKKTTSKPGELSLKLTPEQQKQLVAFMEKSGDARLDVSVTFSADVSRGVIAPATFLVGNAV